MKLHILYNFKNGGWGGGNQFLKALRDYFIKKNIYAESVDEADVVLFNSHHELKSILRKKYKFPNKIFIHRIDGPIFKIRNGDLEIDKIIYKFNELLADGTIFQSNYSRQENYKLGFKKNNFESTIINAPDPNIFNRNNKVVFSKNRQIRLIATSWSYNMRKGFDIYRYLDENLDFSKYEMTFIGNSPVQFKNINWIKPLGSKELASQLKQHDIFITASQKDPCSNSLIEALHCGLPVVSLNDGGHPEIVNKAGEIFNDEKNIIEKIEKIVNNYDQYQRKINLPSIDEVSEKYYNFAKNIHNKFQNKFYSTKKINIFHLFKLLSLVYLWKYSNKAKNIMNKIFKKCTNKI